MRGARCAGPLDRPAPPRRAAVVDPLRHGSRSTRALRANFPILPLQRWQQTQSGANAIARPMACGRTRARAPAWPPVHDHCRQFRGRRFAIRFALTAAACRGRIPYRDAPCRQPEQHPRAALLRARPLRAAYLRARPWCAAPLLPARRVPLACVPLACVPLARVPLARVPLARVPLARVPLARVPLLPWQSGDHVPRVVLPGIVAGGVKLRRQPQAARLLPSRWCGDTRDAPLITERGLVECANDRGRLADHARNRGEPRDPELPI